MTTEKLEGQGPKDGRSVVVLKVIGLFENKSSI
jgi:hypothetical protein